MHFTLITLGVAFASIANASPARLDARQSDQLATCVITTTPSSFPNPESAVLEEFILSKSTPTYSGQLARVLMVFEIVFNNEFQNNLPPGTGVIVSPL